MIKISHVISEIKLHLDFSAFVPVLIEAININFKTMTIKYNTESTLLESCLHLWPSCLSNIMPENKLLVATVFHFNHSTLRVFLTHFPSLRIFNILLPKSTLEFELEHF